MSDHLGPDTPSISEGLPALRPSRRSGAEALHESSKPLGPTVLDFWQWSASDLVSNATRGRFAEFLVGTALGCDMEDVRNEWDAFDLLTKSGIKVEVKSASYLQSWSQERPSSISWKTPTTRAWDPVTKRQSAESRRQADVYVLALLSHMDKTTLDPLDVSQWGFFVVPTRLLNERTRSQHSITLNSVVALVGEAISYGELAEAVEGAAVVHPSQS